MCGCFAPNSRATFSIRSLNSTGIEYATLSSTGAVWPRTSAGIASAAAAAAPWAAKRRRVIFDMVRVSCGKGEGCYLTAVIVTPSMNQRCATRKAITSGAVTTVAAAISGP